MILTESSGLSDIAGNSGECTFSIFDGVQPQVMIQMEASKARTMLALYVSFLQKRLGDFFKHNYPLYALLHAYHFLTYV